MEAIADAQETTFTTVYPRLPPFMDKERARAAAAKSLEVRRQNKLEREEQHLAAQAILKAAAEQGKHAVADADEYRLQRLKTVRAQLERLDEMILTCKDPQKIDRLASASARLNEQEAQLSMRAKPASVRAASPGRKRDLPQPLPPATPQ